MKKIIYFLVAFLISSPLFSQEIVEVTLQETLTKEQLSGVFLGFPVNYGIEAYKVLYETLDTDGTIDTASGLMVLPVNEAGDQFPFLAYQHGTASSRDGVPSNPDAFERRLAYYFAGQGYYTTAADYLGLGESRRVIHPYIHAASEASAGIDLVKAAKTFTEENNLPHSGQVFLTGYSQGGHASMAMHQILDETPIPGLETTAGSHMSGIYNVSGELAQGSIAAVEYQFPSYIVWILVGYQTVYGNLYTDLSEVFQAPYIDDIQGFIDGTVSRGRLNDLLKETLIINHDASIPRFMFTDNFITDLEDTESNSPVQIAMRDNDLFNWVPKTPMRMMYCTADDQVSFTNATFTDSVMNAAGAENVLAVDVNPTADHGGCVIPATFGTIIFFDEFVNRNIVSTQNIDPKLQFSLSPNPASDYINLNFSNLQTKATPLEIQLFNLNGQLVKSISTNKLENYRLPLNDISSGLYLMQVQTEKGFWTEKIIIRSGK